MRKKKQNEVRVGIIEIRNTKNKTQHILEQLYSKGWRVKCSYFNGEYLILENETK